ncbi:MAG TPA: DUF1003 domain-containing protein [Spirochaetota bacterium]|nr:MAG: hypothetical protein BWY96_03001 [Spirochaetes bacterium ADurb.BinA120]HPI15409.1 DUF1003 domain-containing protein [Spirochaetota bacterium]HPO45217.1 DUF1003 domain-containing protein [Spirochaetota bacterium]
MKKIHFPPPFRHNHPPIKNLNDIIDERMTRGQRMADMVARTVGSWRFIIIQSILIACWAALNMAAYIRHWDPYPFILLNLFLSLQAAYTAPIIMMSQNRLAEKDRIEAHNDYLLNVKSEQEIQAVLDHLNSQCVMLDKILEKITVSE